MFCHYCGKEIQDGSAFCLYCGKKVVPAEAGPSFPVRDANRTSSRKRKRRKWPWILLLVVILAGILAGLTAAKLLPLNGTGGAYTGQATKDCYVPNEENIVYEDSGRSFGYVNNMVLVFASASAAPEDIAGLAESVHGTVVGQIAGIRQYQIEVEAADRSDLEALCDELRQSDAVRFAILDDVVAAELNEAAIPNDPWKDTFQGLFGVDWTEDKPSGTNWWVEAAKVLSAWGYDDHFSTIRVGVVDNGFDPNHEDLTITVLNDEVNQAEDHGTHVAGVIGATVNNETGISGICQHVDLYGVDCYATSKQEKTNITVSSLMDGIVTCLDNQCNVINMSSGVKYTNSSDTKSSAEETARVAALYLLAMLDSYEDDFIVVQSAGNGNQANVGVDACTYNGYFASVTEAVVQSVLAELEENDIVLDHEITARDVLDSIMIVGAVDKQQKGGAYQLAKFSNYGSAITVCAPGVDVFSTIVSGGLDGSYGYLDGTSMAAPIVAGITAMVWSVDPSMTSSEVKEIITSTAFEPVQSRNQNDSGTYHMIDACAAVEKAIRQLDAPEQWTVTPDSLIYVYNVDGEAADHYTVTVSFLDLENMPQGPNTSAPKKDTVTYTVSDTAPFELSLSAGIYEIVIANENHEEQYTYYATVSADGDAEHSVYTTFEASVSGGGDAPAPAELSRINYYDPDGQLIYYDSYAYYDNGLLCSTTLHSVNYLSNGYPYTGDVYTNLYLYDENGELRQTVLGSLTISDWYDPDTGELTLGYDFDEAGGSTKRTLYPAVESIEQEKFNVDPSRTEKIYGDAPVLSTDPGGGWASAYLRDVFPGDAPTDMTMCRFLYVDSDSVPELWMDYGYGYAGDEVYTAGGGTTDRIYISQGAAFYIENSNLLLASGGHMDVYYDTVYQIVDGKFVAIAQGNYGAADNSNLQFDANGNVIYEYDWDGTQVTESEYGQRLAGAFDRNRAADTSRNVYTYEQAKLLLQAIAASSAPEPDAAGGGSSQAIPSDAVFWNGHSYKLYDLDSVTTWEDAQAYCAGLGGYLAVISSQEENDFLYQLITGQGCQSAYFGVTDAQTEGTWLWVDGSSDPYANWHSGEPNSENPNEDYGMFYWKYTDGTWNDGDFGGKTVQSGRAFLCEWDVS